MCLIVQAETKTRFLYTAEENGMRIYKYWNVGDKHYIVLGKT